MVVSNEARGYLAKALESLVGAEIELQHHNYNNCANRCYYACFQAAVAALLTVGIQARSSSGHWRHQTVHAQFVEQLINRRRIFSPTLRTVMSENILLRNEADYEVDSISEKQASRVLRQSRNFVEAVRTEGDRVR